MSRKEQKEDGELLFHTSCIDDIVVPLVYSDLNKTPTLLCKTIYRKGKHG
jgi:hypothetical protein